MSKRYSTASQSKSGTRINAFRDPRIWQLGMEIVRKTYRLSEKLPSKERFGLESQMRRAAVALPANIAEGFRRRHPREYRQFLHVGLGSSAELETCLELARSIYSVDGPGLKELLSDIDVFQKMAMTLISRLSTHDS